jgi:hypothetical protein
MPKHRKLENWEPVDYQDAYLVSARFEDGVVKLRMKDYLGKLEITFEGVKAFRINLQRVWGRASECEPVPPSLTEVDGHSRLLICGYASWTTRPAIELFEVEFDTAHSERFDTGRSKTDFWGRPIQDEETTEEIW